MKLLLVILFASSLRANTVTATTCGSTDVQTAINAITTSPAIVNIPSGTCHWSAQVSYTISSGIASFTIQGASTITGACSPSSATCTAADNTVIVDDYASTNSLFGIVTQTGCTLTRITGITFKAGSGLVKQTGMVAIDGSCHNFRMDHNHFLLNPSGLSHIGVRYDDWVWGVTDHNLCDMTTSGTSECFNVWASTYGGTPLGDGAWAAATNLGTANFMYLENNVNNNGLYFDDCDASGREVNRFNVINNAQMQTHPTGSAPNAIRGCRAKEVYLNQFNGQASCDGSGGFNNCLFNMYFLSAGAGVFWGNTAPVVNAGAGSGYQWIISIHSMRRDNSTYPQGATPNGWGYCGTSFNGTGSNWDQNTSAMTGYACLDQPGRGQSDLLSGDFPSTINTTTGTIAWPHQVLEPYYEWLDTMTPVPMNPGGVLNNFNPDVLVANQDFYLGTGSFTGATGVGSGLLSARPGTCTTGVAYWATDQGSWNSSGSGGQGVLYKCVSTNTWSSFYTPYTYPHPLTQGGGGGGTGATRLFGPTMTGGASVFH